MKEKKFDAAVMSKVFLAIGEILDVCDSAENVKGGIHSPGKYSRNKNLDLGVAKTYEDNARELEELFAAGVIDLNEVITYASSTLKETAKQLREIHKDEHILPG